ncbi:MAG TPA: protein kinase, partial [Terriglobales bacterium]|nr:protein kinase [Terriglobales bacterium]
LDGRSDIFSFGVVLYEMATGRKPFIGRNSVFVVDAIMNQKPISPLKWNPKLPKGFEAIMGKALEKKRDNRYQNARELRADLQQLKRESESNVSAVTTLRKLPNAARTFSWWSPRHIYLQLGIAAVIALILLFAALRWNQGSKGTAVADDPSRSIAVLPLAEVGGGKAPDALRISLSDGMASTLTGSHTLQVRPVAASAKYSDANLDAARAGQELGVATILTGHFLRESGELRVTVQAIDVKSNSVLWESTVTGANEKEIQDKISSQLRSGLLPLLTRPASQ